MVTIEATVQSVEDKHFLTINIEDGPVKIPLSDDNPNEVKSAFNKIIKRIAKGEITIKLDKVEENLFSLVANEYVTQLNSEIQEVRSQMEAYGLVKAEPA